MPEGPEIHIAARFINQVAKKHDFGGRIIKSEVSTKNPDVEFTAKKYKINAEARGKELKVFLEDENSSKKKTHILFRFGMSGCFNLTSADELPKHSHLRFQTLDKKDPQVLSFVDYRRFGRWEIEGEWGKDRGPDPIFDYENFRKNVIEHLDVAAFNKPICEAMLDQKYFNGVGNYLRAEILYRASIKPFSQAREILESLNDEGDLKNPDVLDLCHIIMKEVLSLNKGKNYDPDFETSDTTFSEWLQCYYVEGMNNLQDGHGRTMWFHGEPGPMVPKNARVVGRKGGTGSKVPQSGTNAKEHSYTKEAKPKKRIKKEVKSEETDEDVKVPKNLKREIKTEVDDEEEVKPKSRKKDVKASKKIKTEIKAEADEEESKPKIVKKSIKKEVKSEETNGAVVKASSKRLEQKIIAETPTRTPKNSKRTQNHKKKQ